MKVGDKKGTLGRYRKFYLQHASYVSTKELLKFLTCRELGSLSTCRIEFINKFLTCRELGSLSTCRIEFKNSILIESGCVLIHPAQSNEHCRSERLKVALLLFYNSPVWFSWRVSRFVFCLFKSIY